MTTNMKAVSKKSINANNVKAKEILEREGSYTYQRKIRPKVVKNYSEKMLNGEFRHETPIAMGLNTRTREFFVVDGYHRLSALAAIEDESFTLPISIEIYHCKSAEEIEKLYETFDPAPRTITDYISVQAQKSGMQDFSSVTLSWVMRYEHNMKNMTFNHSVGRLSKADNAKLILGKEKTIEFIEGIKSDLIGKKDNIAFKNGMVAFCIAHSFDAVDETIAAKFWNDVLSLSDAREDGSVIEYNNPARTFRRTITNAYLQKSSSWWGFGKDQRKRVALLYQSAIRNWLSENTMKTIPVNMESEFEWDGATAKKLSMKKEAVSEKKRQARPTRPYATETVMTAN